MKMRASLSNVVVCCTAAVCITAIVQLFPSLNGKFATLQANSTKSLLSTKRAVPPASTKLDSKWNEAYGRLPMGFQENEGQTDPAVRFLSHGQGYELFLTPQEAVLALRRSPASVLTSGRSVAALKSRSAKNWARTTTSVLRMQMFGANPDAQVTGLNELPGKTDYFLGNNREGWRTNVPSYARVKYSGVYPGVDLVFYGNQRSLEYDFIVAPGADPKAIALNIAGAKKLSIDAHGNLVVSAAAGAIELKKPVVYQEVDGQRREIAANYSLSGSHRVNFAVASYDRSKPLILDPVLNYSTYLGGSSVGDFASGIAIDAAGDAYVTGQTFSTTFPLSGGTIGYNTNSPDAGVATNGAVFVSELDPTGSTELYFSYLGGTGAGEGGEVGNGIAVDTTGVYITGQTFSSNFPTVNGYITSAPSGNPGSAFLAKLNPAVTGSPSLVYSTYVGGPNGDSGHAIAIDSSQNAYITGVTFSSNISTTGAFLSSPPDSTDGNAFLTRIDTTQAGASPVYSTYLGGSGANAGGLGFADIGLGIAVASGNAYISGATASTNFPVTTQTANTTAAFQSTPNTSNVLGTVFVSEINTNSGAAAQLVYSTYLGGEGQDIGYAIGLGPNNVAYVTGSTTSLQFPTAASSGSSTPFQTTGNAAGVVFVSLLDATKNGASSLTYSTYLGGNFGDIGFGIKADSAGNAYVAGSTDSIGSGIKFPLTPGALQTTSTNTQGNAFVTEISPLGNGAADLMYSTLLGGSGNGTFPDEANGIALDSTNNAYIAGQTASTDFPVFPNPGAFQTTLPGGTISAFVAKLTLVPTVVVTPTTLSFGTVLEGTTSAAQTVTITNNTGTVVPLTLSLTGNNPGDFAAAGGGAAPCGANLAANNTPCTVSVTFTPSAIVNGAESANLVVGYTTYGIVNSQTVTLTGTGSNTALTVAPGVITFTGQLVTTTSATQPVTVTNSSASSGAVSLTNTTDFSYTVAAADPAGCTLTATPANTTCVYNVAFNPAAGDTGALTSTFAVTAGGSTQTATLNGTGWDFNFTPSTQSVSVAPGGTASPTVTATFLGGFTGPVTLSCSGSIPQGSCTVPASVSASGPVTVTLTTKGSSMVPPASLKTPPISRRQVMLIGFAILLLFTVPFARRRRARLGLVGALVMIVGLAACSGSSGTPAGAYNLTVTGTSNGVTRTAAITLNVT